MLRGPTWTSSSLSGIVPGKMTCAALGPLEENIVTSDLPRLTLGTASGREGHSDHDPLAAARARFREHQPLLLAEAGPMLSADEVAQRLGVSPVEVETRRKAHGLLAVQVDEAWRYPAFQLTGDQLLPGLPAVLAQLAPSGPWVTLDNLLARDEALYGRNVCLSTALSRS